MDEDFIIHKELEQEKVTHFWTSLCQIKPNNHGTGRQWLPRKWRSRPYIHKSKHCLK